VNDINILIFKLNEYRDSLMEEMKNLSHNESKDALEKELSELTQKANEIKTRIKSINVASKSNKSKILEIARKLKAIKQLV
jgi:predicted  nucleic acid-binding Zn-ribbon protein